MHSILQKQLPGQEIVELKPSRHINWNGSHIICRANDLEHSRGIAWDGVPLRQHAGD